MSGLRMPRPVAVLPYSGPRNRIRDEYLRIQQERQLGNITPAEFRTIVVGLNQAQRRYEASIVKRAEKRIFMKEQAEAFQREYEKEQKRLEKQRLDKQAEIRAQLAIQAVRMEREAKEKAMKEKREARKTKAMFTGVLTQMATPRAIPFSRLGAWSSIRIPDGPFVLTLRSAIANVTREFRFSSREHFQRWLTAIDAMNVIKESDNFREISEIMGTKPEIFRDVIPSFQSVVGGCQWNGKEKQTIETPFHTLTVYSPQTKHNNCGFKVIEHITGNKLDYAEERKKHNIGYDEPLSVEVFSTIFRKHANDILIVIDKTFDSTFDFKKYEYILHDNGHYHHITDAKEKTFKDKKTNRGLLCWDIETRPTFDYVMVGEQKSYILKPSILCAYYVPFQGEAKKITFVTDEYDCCRLFLNWLTYEANAGRFYHCIAHNASRFDHYFLINQLSEVEQYHTETQLRGHSVIGIQYKSHLFKDSCCFLTNSLDALCKAFKVKEAKLTSFIYQGVEMTNKNICFYRPELGFTEFMDLRYDEPEFWELYEDYCMMDCVSLFQIWKTFSEQYGTLVEKMFQYRPELLKNVRLLNTNTIGSLAKKILENTCLVKARTGKYVHKKEFRQLLEFHSTDGKEDTEKLLFINQFKRGGISHTQQPGKHTHELISYDIASQYPAAMMNMLVPVGKSEWVTSYNTMRHGFYHLKNLVFTGRRFKPVAEKLETGVLNWATDDINEVCVDSFMIRYLQKNYGLESFDVVRGLVSSSYVRGSTLFGDYVETLYGEKKRQDALKKSSSDEYNPALRECIKLFLNSLSGKLVEDPSHYFKLEYVPTSNCVFNGLNVEKKVDSKKMNPWVACGVMVYSWSKRVLFEYVRCLPNDSDDVIHIETDSIYFNKKWNDTFRENINNYSQNGLDYYPIAIGDELGNVKVEKDTAEESYFLGKKFYCIGDLYKIKGIPLKTIDVSGNDVTLVDKTLYEDVYQGKTIRREFYTMKKSLFSEKTTISSHKMSRCVQPAMKYMLYE